MADAYVPLNEQGASVSVHPRVSIRTPGLSGRVRVHAASGGGQDRGPELKQDEFIEAMRRNDLEEDLTVEIDEPAERTPSQGSRGQGASDDMVLEVRDPGEAFGQFVLYESEDGVLSWHLPEGQRPTGGLTRGGGGTLTYRIPKKVALAEPAEGSESRGILGAAGKKILKIITFRLIREGAKYLGAHFAERLEATRKPHGVRTFLPGEHRMPATQQMTDDQLRALEAGRALLFVHGTFSSSHAGFGTMPDATLTELHKRYGGRVLAFDHPTVATTPAENIAWLANRLRDAGVHLEVDIVCHSRGGLVGRVITERPDLGTSHGVLSVGRMVMVATPNAGTALADVKNLEHLLNRFTNLLQFVPDNGVTDVLDILLAVIKQVAAGIAEGLDGLMAMNPQGKFLTEQLNRPDQTDATYFAAASNFEPPQGSKLLRIARNVGTDYVFADVHNDLVVPTDGVFTLPGDAKFPVADPLVFEAAAGVDHSGYWTQPPFNERLLQWLDVAP